MGMLLVTVIAVLLLIFAYRDALSALDRARDALALAHVSSARQSERHQHLDQLLQREDGQVILLAAGSEGEAQAGLQQHLGAALENASAELARLEVLPAITTDGHRRISLRADFRVDLSGLRRLLHRLEYGLPLVVIERLSIRAPGGRVLGPDRRLTVDMQITALQRAAAP